MLSHIAACLQVALPCSLLTLLQSLVVEDKWPLERALPLLTLNPATRLQLPHKGQVRWPIGRICNTFAEFL